MELAAERWPGYDKMWNELIAQHQFLANLNSTIITNFADDAAPCTARAGDTCFNAAFVVPKNKEAGGFLFHQSPFQLNI
jgi:hypothetical protein